MAKYVVDLAGVVGWGMWGSVPEEIAREALQEYWEEQKNRKDFRPPKAPVILRHPPTYEEWLDSLPWVLLPAVIPMDSTAPDEGRSRVRFLGYRDDVTYDYGSPVRVCFRRFELLPKNG